MRLMRNTTPDGSCKYAAVRKDKIALLNAYSRTSAEQALEMLKTLGVLEDPSINDPDEFFLIKLHDINAPPALIGYAGAASRTDIELARDVLEAACRSLTHPNRKQPD